MMGWMEERKKMLKTTTSGNSEILLVLINLKRVFKWGCLKLIWSSDIFNVKEKQKKYVRHKNFLDQ